VFASLNGLTDVLPTIHWPGVPSVKKPTALALGVRFSVTDGSHQTDHSPHFRTHQKRAPAADACKSASPPPKHRMPENKGGTNPLTLIAELHHTMLETEAKVVNPWL